MKKLSTLALIALSMFINVSFAQSGKVSIQGILKNFDGTVVTDGSYDMEFNIYTQPTGGTSIWTETQSGADAVQISGGVYNTALGKTSVGLTALQTLSFDVPYYVGITVQVGTNPLEMTPRIELAYAINTLHADYADTAQVALTAMMAQGVQFSGGSGVSEAGGDLTLSGDVVSGGDVIIGGNGILNADTITANYINGKLQYAPDWSTIPSQGNYPADAGATVSVFHRSHNDFATAWSNLANGQSANLAYLCCNPMVDMDFVYVFFDGTNYYYSKGNGAPFNVSTYWNYFNGIITITNNSPGFTLVGFYATLTHRI